MDAGSSESRDECERIGEMAVWLPSGTLEPSERAEVERHVARCPACAELLEFASKVKDTLIMQVSPHPDPDALVCFAEARAKMDSDVRREIENHLAMCPDCREEVAMLEAVDRESAGEVPRAMVARRGRADRRGAASGFRRFWEKLRASVLRPVPAAVYLVLAVVALGLYLTGPSREGGIAIDGGGRGGVEGSSGISGTLGGTVILPDETSRLREPGARPPEPTEVEAGRAQFILLELVGLKSAPAENDIYTVEVIEDRSGGTVLTAPVAGREFRDNYTLCLFLGEGGMAPGLYTVRVIAPGGDTVFRSSMVAR